MRLLLIIPYVFFLQTGDRTMAALTYLVAIVTDMDGTIARRMKTTSTFGSFYDPTVDALFMMSAMFLLAQHGNLLLIPLAIYIVSVLFKLIPALLYYGKNKQVRNSILSKTIAFSGFLSVLLGTLAAPPLLTGTLLLVGAAGNTAMAVVWLRQK